MAAHSAKPAFDFMGHLCGNGSLRRLGLRVLLDLAGYRPVNAGLKLGGILRGTAFALGPAQQPDEAGDHQAQRDAHKRGRDPCT